MRKKSSGVGAVQTASWGSGAVKSVPDRQRGGVPAQRAAILDDDHDSLRFELNGEAIRYVNGFHAIVEDKQMWIPFSRTTCPAEALRIAKAQGLISAKLYSMDESRRELLLALTLARAEPEN
jgi:hypothetical protein